MSGTFVYLPPEVRQIIWTMALGEHGDTPTMVPWRTARPYILEEEDDDYDDHEEEEGESMATYMGEEPREHGSEGHRENVWQPGLKGEAPRPVVDSNDGRDEDDDIEDYDDDDDEDSEYEYQPANPYAREPAWDDDVLIPVYLPPLLLVSREARAITLAWLARHNVQLTRTKIEKGEINTGFPPTPDGTLPPYVRRYDPARDHLYVDRRYWRRFCSRLHMIHSLTDEGRARLEQHLTLAQLEEIGVVPPRRDIGAEIFNLALPAFTVYQSTEAVAEALRFLPRLESMACLWGELPSRDWCQGVIYETVQDAEGRKKKQVRQLLMPRWDPVQFSETVSEEELERRRRDTERIKAEREERKRNKGKEVKQDEDDGEEEEEEEEEEGEEEDEDEEEEGEGPLVTICIRDSGDSERVFWERGYLGTWMREVFNVLAFCELPDHVKDDYDGSFTLPIVACKAVCPTAVAAPAVADKATASKA